MKGLKVPGSIRRAALIVSVVAVTLLYRTDTMTIEYSPDACHVVGQALACESAIV